MEEINFWDPRNFANWQEFRNFWRDHYERAGKTIENDSDIFWKSKYEELKNGNR